ncbi:hypothetical protein WDU94_005892 [Cyamophila willieti]
MKSLWVLYLLIVNISGLIESILKLFILLNYLFLTYFVFSIIYNWLRRYMCRQKTCKPPVNFALQAQKCTTSPPQKRHSIRSIGCQPSMKSFSDLVCYPRKKPTSPRTRRSRSPCAGDSGRRLPRPTSAKLSNHSRCSTSQSSCPPPPGTKIIDMFKRKIAAILSPCGDERSRSRGRPRSSQGRGEGCSKNNTICEKMKNQICGSKRAGSCGREKRMNRAKSSSSFENIRVEFNLKGKGEKCGGGAGGMKPNQSCTKCGKCFRGKR